MSSSPSPTTPGVPRRWLFLILALAFLFVLMPFLFWQSTWFGRPLSDSDIDKQLADVAHPRKVQHAMFQLAERLSSPDLAQRASARRWYPQLIALTASPVAELRLTSAAVMGQSTDDLPEFRAALTALLTDPNPMVQRNAALSLTHFRDAAGHAVILSMLEPYREPSPLAGTLSQRLKPGDTVNPGTLIGRIVVGEEKHELRCEVPGTLDRWLVSDGSPLSVGQNVAEISPSADVVKEALRALVIIGQPADLPLVERYTRPLPNLPDFIRQQASLTARSLRSRAP